MILCNVTAKIARDDLINGMIHNTKIEVVQQHDIADSEWQRSFSPFVELLVSTMKNKKNILN